MIRKSLSTEYGYVEKVHITSAALSRDHTIHAIAPFSIFITFQPSNQSSQYYCIGLLIDLSHNNSLYLSQTSTNNTHSAAHLVIHRQTSQKSLVHNFLDSAANASHDSPFLEHVAPSLRYLTVQTPTYPTPCMPCRNHPYQASPYHTVHPRP